MGYLPQPTPEMGEYSVEVRQESFYLHGEDPTLYFFQHGDHPRHAMHVSQQRGPEDDMDDFGTVEILIEDIPKIRAALDQVERIVKGERA